MQLRTRLVRAPALDLDFEVLEGDQHIGPAIERGTWEAHESALFRAHLRPGAGVLDVGANVGWFSVLALLAGCRVHAFEPVPEIAEVCARNLARAQARAGGQAELHRVAASDHPGRARMLLSPTNFGDNRVLDEGAARPGDLRGAEEIEIELARVDDLVQESVRVIKIDTQGSEWLALQGMRRVLAANHDLALLLEFWPYALRGARPEQLLELLSAQGFRLAKATAAPYPMTPARILRQALARDPVRGGIDLYAVRGLAFHVLGPLACARSLWRRAREG